MPFHVAIDTFHLINLITVEIETFKRHLVVFLALFSVGGIKFFALLWETPSFQPFHAILQDFWRIL